MSLDSWAAKAVHEVTLPSGEVRSIRLPSLQHMIAAGKIPPAVLERMQKVAVAAAAGEASGGVLSPEDAAQDLQFKAVVITEMLPEDEDVELIAKYVEEDKLPSEDVDKLMSWAMRLEPLPGKGP